MQKYFLFWPSLINGFCYMKQNKYYLNAKEVSKLGIRDDTDSLKIQVLAVKLEQFLCPATRKWRGIMLYPPKF